MLKKEVTHRVEVNYLSTDRDDLALVISTPYYSESEAEEAYRDALSHRCTDRDAPARVTLLKYTPDGLQVVKTNH